MRTKIAINPYIYIFSIIFLIKTNILTICEGYISCHKGTTRGINPASGTANTRPCNESIGFEQLCHLWNIFYQFDRSNQHSMTYMYSTRSGHSAFYFQRVYYKYDTNKNII